jgi:hypothetical protein
MVTRFAAIAVLLPLLSTPGVALGLSPLDAAALKAGCAGPPQEVTPGFYRCATSLDQHTYFSVPNERAKQTPRPAEKATPTQVTQPGPRWQSLKADDKMELEFDTQRPFGAGNVRRAWLRWNYTSAKEVWTYGPKYKTGVTLQFYNCKEGTEATVYSIFYSEPYGAGEIVHQSGRAVEPASGTYQATIPGSYGEALLNYVCGQK